MDDLIQILLLLAITVVPSLLGGKNKKKKEAEKRRRMQQQQMQQQQQQPQPEPFEEPKRKLTLDGLENISEKFEEVNITDLFSGFIKPKARRAPEKKAPVQPAPAVRRPVEEGSDGSLSKKTADSVFTEPEPEKKKEKIDLRNLVVYSEIMKPKYDEY